ncbi:MAG TPA: HlyD family type I secretion periplasmic adaptor subunit [Alphaproteobacteria bacterium]|nr:HlyD family type I secretion periplasmic adaptor subunit [Alphaproteobacteria bacterium]
MKRRDLVDRPSGDDAPAERWGVVLDAKPEKPPSLRNTVIAGLTTIAVAFGGILGWATFARLDAAAIAPGVVIVDSNRKTIQHLEGGIIRELLVENGERVSEGQVLVRMDPTFARAEVGRLESQQWSARSRLVRLRAEAEGVRDIGVFDGLLDEARTDVARRIVEDARALFRSRWSSFDSRISGLERQIEQSEKEIAALDVQIEAASEQLVYTREELEAVKALYEKGYERRPRLLELQRNVSALIGAKGEYEADKARAQQEIAGMKAEIAHETSARQAEISEGLVETQAELSDVEDLLSSARNVMQRVEVRAPQDGLVTGLKFFAAGAVVQPGEPILDIVPLNDNLVIEAMVNPRDIDTIFVGAPVNIRLTAYKQKNVPVVEGTLRYIAADTEIDERTGDAFYPSRVVLDPESLEQIDRVELYPGMPAEVMIVTGERRAIDYFLAPITDGMQRALREE